MGESHNHASPARPLLTHRPPHPQTHTGWPRVHSGANLVLDRLAGTQALRAHQAPPTSAPPTSASASCPSLFPVKLGTDYREGVCPQASPVDPTHPSLPAPPLLFHGGKRPGLNQTTPPASCAAVAKSFNLSDRRFLNHKTRLAIISTLACRSKV